MVVCGVCFIDLFVTAISRQLVYSYSFVDCKEMLCIANVIGGDETSTGMVWVCWFVWYCLVDIGCLICEEDIAVEMIDIDSCMGIMP